ncbi:ComEA family DNA-binding protein [Piscinibacterium candidicorallinum]|uniref:ComEA family DNA-binding protein n=1 Tax=Piscinibacterium candidicorallinum TaxID=1793872 RepID=A0ABV7GXR0_9BURK
MLKKLVFALLALLASINLAWAAVDVNTATAAELDSVKGIGPAISKNIIKERRKAPFKDWADFRARVDGVGDKTIVTMSEGGLTVGGKSYAGAPAKAASAAAPAAKTMPAPTPAPAPAAKAASAAVAPAAASTSAAPAAKDMPKATATPGGPVLPKPAAPAAKDAPKAAAPAGGPVLPKAAAEASKDAKKTDKPEAKKDEKK